MSTAHFNNFNTLQYAEALKSAGVPDAPAKAQAQALDRALWEAGFATYEGIKDFRAYLAETATKADIAELTMATEADIAGLRAEIQAMLNRHLQFMLGVMVALTAIYAAIVKRL